MLATPRSRFRRRARRPRWCRGGARCDSSRIELLRGREFLLRLGGLPEAAQHEREIEVRVGVVRVEGDDFLVQSRRFRRATARVRPDDREIEEGLLVAGLHVEREPVVRLSRDEPTLKMRYQAQVEEGRARHRTLGSIVPPSVTVGLFGPAVAMSARPPVGAVPSPMSSVAVPLRVTEPSGFDVPLVIQPVIVIHWLRPIRLEPFNCISRSPMADPSVAISAPRPKVPPASSMPLNVAPAGETPAPPPVTMLSPTMAAA